MIQFILMFVFVLSHGFLLQTNTTINTQTAGNQQYITKLELYDTKNQLQNDLINVRNDMNTKLDLLTSQLQQMLTSFQQQITGQGSHNDSRAIEILELCNEVMGNYTKLQKEFDSLKIKYSKQEIELQSVKNKTKDLEVEIVNLNSLKNINQLTDFRILQQEVQSISTQTHSLAVNEQARIQDFQALYNSLKEHEANEDGIIQSLNLTLHQKIQRSEISTNASLLNVMTRISESENHHNRKIDEFEQVVNVSFLDIRQQIAKNNEKVALTACAEPSEFGPQPSGHIIQYRDIRTQLNVNNISSFIRTGKFTCEKEGLYLVSAWDLSHNGDFAIEKNGNLIAYGYITNGNGMTTYSGTAVVVVELLPNDTVWVQVGAQITVGYPQKSCLTIVKVK